jgi:uncharacterized membrane protein YciS (DUF1049 family)
MSDLHDGVLIKGHRPVHAFYLPPYSNLVLSSATAKDRFATSPTSTIHTAIPTRIRHSTSHSIMSSSNSASPSVSPFIIENSLPPLSSPVQNDSSPHISLNENSSDLSCWIAPLLGVLGALGVIATITICCRRRRRHRNKKEAAAAAIKRQQQQSPDTFTSSYQQRTLTNSYQSWNSFSTIRNDENKKSTISNIFPPTTTNNNKQKRWTADTLVEEPTLAMLKKQYSPQLAFSPSLVAGELQQQQQQQHLPALPETAVVYNHHLSPSNTLIDNAGVLSSSTDSEKKSYFHHFEHGLHRPRIEMYDPQVNLHDESPFETPYPYCNDQNQESHSTRNQEKEASYQVIDINDKPH